VREQRHHCGADSEFAGRRRQESRGGERPPRGKGWLGLGCPVVWASKRRQILTRASISTRVGCPGKRSGSRRDFGLPKGPLGVNLDLSHVMYSGLAFV
jgi:hypothetical protein